MRPYIEELARKADLPVSAYQMPDYRNWFGRIRRSPQIMRSYARFCKSRICKHYREDAVAQRFHIQAFAQIAAKAMTCFPESNSETVLQA